MKLAELLAQDDVQLNDGDYIVAVTEPAGYVPTYKDTFNIHTGQYLFKVLTSAGQTQVVPVINSEDGKEFVDDVDNPIIVQGNGEMSYVTGRNHPDYKDGYNGTEVHIVRDIESGEEHRHVLLAFIEFVKSEYSLGVHDFNVEDAKYFGDGEPDDSNPDPDPDPEPGDEDDEEEGTP